MREPDSRPRRLSVSAWNRLYVRVYLALLGSLAIAVTLFALAHWRFDPSRVGGSMDTFADLAGDVLPSSASSASVQQEALLKLSRRMHADLALFTEDKAPIASAGRTLPPLNPLQARSGWHNGNPQIFVLALPDGRWLEGRRVHTRLPTAGLFSLLLIIAGLVAAGAFPVVRRLTGRLERLQASVETWGAGQLSTRVKVEGNDEVARLAESFNDSAARIEAMVTAQKSLLANASHELRSPLARIRMAVELMQEPAPPAMREELARNVAELDQLIGEVLLASRLDATGSEAMHTEVVDLTALLAEECARANAELEAGAFSVQGDPRLLRRMVRNLLENAVRYGAGGKVRVLFAHTAAGLELDVCDQGAGVPPSERERVFEPFHRVPGTSEASGGVGLGLSLVRQIARAHGGEVRCLENELGGSCFRVTLPAA